MPNIVSNVNSPLDRAQPTRLGPFERAMSLKDFKAVLSKLHVFGSDLGPVNHPARKALSEFLAAHGKQSSDRITNAVFFDLQEC